MDNKATTIPTTKGKRKPLRPNINHFPIAGCKKKCRAAIAEIKRICQGGGCEGLLASVQVPTPAADHST